MVVKGSNSLENNRFVASEPHGEKIHKRENDKRLTGIGSRFIPKKLDTIVGNDKTIVIDAKNLKQFFKEFTNEEDFIPLKELEKLILKNFNKSTINLKNIDEEKKTFKLLIEIMQ